MTTKPAQLDSRFQHLVRFTFVLMQQLARRGRFDAGRDELSAKALAARMSEYTSASVEDAEAVLAWLHGERYIEVASTNPVETRWRWAAAAPIGGPLPAVIRP